MPVVSLRHVLRWVVVGLPVWLAGPGPAQGQTPLAAFEQAYGELLQRYWRPPVTIHGIRTTVFDYGRLVAERAAAPQDHPLDRSLQALAAVAPEALTPAQAKALWINAYNLGAIRLIVDHYPVDSIRSPKINLLRYPWWQDAVTVGGRRYSLSEIERGRLLARDGDLRILFAVGCAAVSCPDRGREPYRAAGLEDQLDATVRALLRNPTKGMAVDRQRGILRLSAIFDIERRLFGGDAGIRAFVGRYVEGDLRDWIARRRPRLQFWAHDWTVNDSAQADRPAAVTPGAGPRGAAVRRGRRPGAGGLNFLPSIGRSQAWVESKAGGASAA